MDQAASRRSQWPATSTSSTPVWFSGLWVEGTGAAGLETSRAGDLWLKNKAGVIMHLTGTQSGVTLSLGKDELFIKLGAAD